MFGQSVANMYSSVVKYLPTLYEALSLLPSTMYRNKAQQMFGQEGEKYRKESRNLATS